MTLASVIPNTDRIDSFRLRLVSVHIQHDNSKNSLNIKQMIALNNNFKAENTNSKFDLDSWLTPRG